MARELRNHAANLDAARLQEVSQQLARKPELAGLNRENVEKMLAVVAGLDTLRGSPAVQQLRQAVQVLHQPSLTLSMQPPGMPSLKGPGKILGNSLLAAVQVNQAMASGSSEGKMLPLSGSQASKKNCRFLHFGNNSKNGDAG